MHQASILMTAFVMIMAGAWLYLYESSGGQAAVAQTSASQTASAQASAENR